MQKSDVPSLSQAPCRRFLCSPFENEVSQGIKCSKHFKNDLFAHCYSNLSGTVATHALQQLVGQCSNSRTVATRVLQQSWYCSKSGFCVQNMFYCLLGQIWSNSSLTHIQPTFNPFLAQNSQLKCYEVQLRHFQPAFSFVIRFVPLCVRNSCKLNIKIRKYPK